MISKHQVSKLHGNPA